MNTRFNLKNKRVFLLQNNDLEAKKVYSLNKEDSHHWKNVLRAKEGQELEIACKKSRKVFFAVINEINQESVKVKLLEEIENNIFNAVNQEILVAIPKNKALENLIEKSVELSVRKIHLFMGDHSVNKLNENKLIRLNKIIEEASKQSKQNFIAELNLTTDSLEAFLTSYKENVDIYVCSLNEDVKNTNELNLSPDKTQLIIIGPEGDFSKTELNTLKAFNCTYISLGTSILKVDTAVISAISALKARTIADINQ